ncbi:MAG: hypothetical protein HQ553_07065 [Chloroflexi bacterium]|nr:hypothetical protein [Chloroflexota bacterium]
MVSERESIAAEMLIVLGSVPPEFRGITVKRQHYIGMVIAPETGRRDLLGR